MSENSHLINKISELSSTPIENFGIEDLRIMIGQNQKLESLIPKAIEELDKNILAEGDFYPGDLLKNILDSEHNYWKRHKEFWLAIIDLYQKNEAIISTSTSYKELKNSFEIFSNIFDSY